jgi:nitrite reductase/ring-hydroxylating ferredoxin subunit
MSEKMTLSDHDGDGACGCDSRGRRAFLGKAAWLAALAVAALGASDEDARAFPLTFLEGGRGRGDERTYPIPSADGATIDRENQVIVVRYSNKAYAFLLSCPHQNTALRWLAAENRFQCPRHESKYKPDGHFMTGRATRNMDRFAIRKDGNNLVVDLAKWYRSDEQAAEWEAASAAL